MQIWLKLLIVWLVAIALPAQGVAGVTMAHCGSTHERMAAGVAAAGHQHADTDAGAAHHHDAEASNAPTADGAELAGPESEPCQFSDLAQYKCSSCASCCAGSALPSSMPRIPQAKDAPVVFSNELVTVDAFASDGPDRPPRTRLV